MCLHHKTCEEWVEIWKSVLLHTWYLYRFEFIGQAQKSIKKFLYMVIEGNRSIWFGAIFPYMVMEGNEGILFSAIKNTVDVVFLLELVLYQSSIYFNPVVLFVWGALHLYEELYMDTKHLSQWLINEKVVKFEQFAHIYTCLSHDWL